MPLRNTIFLHDKEEIERNALENPPPPSVIVALWLAFCSHEVIASKENNEYVKEWVRNRLTIHPQITNVHIKITVYIWITYVGKKTSQIYIGEQKIGVTYKILNNFETKKYMVIIYISRR